MIPIEDLPSLRSDLDGYTFGSELRTLAMICYKLRFKDSSGIHQMKLLNTDLLTDNGPLRIGWEGFINTIGFIKVITTSTMLPLIFLLTNPKSRR